MGEFAFINWLRQRTSPHARTLLGPGDDAAAVLWPAGVPAVLATDMLLEGSCFLREAGGRRIGRKALAVNLSDLAAMAARPVAALVSVGLPRRSSTLGLGGRQLAEELDEGLRTLASEFEVSIVGGDTNTWDGPLVINVAVLGEPGPAGLIRRSGARLGDRLLVTGPLGGSILGKHLDFTPRVREALTLAELLPSGQVRAMIDISDGLAADVWHLCEESRCGAVLWANAIPLSQEALSMAGSPLEHALGDGEDFELVLAVEPTQADQLIRDQPLYPISGVTLYQIGEIVESGLWLDEPGGRRPLSPAGWVHVLD